MKEDKLVYWARRAKNAFYRFVTTDPWRWEENDLHPTGGWFCAHCGRRRPEHSGVCRWVEVMELLEELNTKIP